MAQTFLSGGGEMGALMRGADWQATPVGHPDQWPSSLRTMISLMLSARHPMFIWWGTGLIQFYNDAYRETMGPERHPSALGQEGRKCWLEIWDIIGPQIEDVMNGKGATREEDRLVPVTRNGRRENVWWTYSFNPIENGQEIGGVLVICSDVTKQHLTKASLEEETRELGELLEQAPSFMAVTNGPNHVVQRTNASYRKLVGERSVIGNSIRQAFPELEGQGYFEKLDEVYKTGRSIVGIRTPLFLRTESEDELRQMYVDFVYAPIFANSREVIGIFIEGSDVTDHVLNEEHLRLLNNELQHRVKNTLTVIGAIAAQTFKGLDADGSVKKFQSRLSAFAKAHDSITDDHWATATLAAVVEGALAPHRSGEGTFAIGGPPVTLGAKQAVSFAMAIHELGTNAIKYGALSIPNGRIGVAWNVELIDHVPHLVFKWTESGGPKIMRPSATGFGSRLIDGVVKGDLGGVSVLRYHPDGFEFTFQAPLSKLAK
jgi:two-component sensor histidine kinase